MTIAPPSRYEPLGAARDLVLGSAEVLADGSGAHAGGHVLENLHNLISNRRAHGFYGIGNPDYAEMVERMDAAASAGGRTADQGYDEIVAVLRAAVEGRTTNQDGFQAVQATLTDMAARLAE